MKMPVREDARPALMASAQDLRTVLLCKAAWWKPSPVAIGQVSSILGRRAECSSLFELWTLVTLCSNLD